MGSCPRILTIAGSDSGGGAGIQADLKTFTVLGTYGMSVITALTAQNTLGVTGIEAPSPEFVALQLKTVMDDIPPNAAKTGMLFSAGIIEALAPHFKNTNFPLVVDPVCVATSGDRLLEESAVNAMAEHIFPYADLVTPNISEAELFAGMDITETGHIMKALDRILSMGPKAVLIKGGHFGSGALTDWLGVRGEKPLPLMQRRIKTDNTHGTGCTLSAAIAAGLGSGYDLVPAVVRAQRFLNLGLRSSFNPGRGSGPVNHLARLEKLEARSTVLDRLEPAVEKLAGIPVLAELMPRTGMHIVAALPHADTFEEVAGFSGRIDLDCRGRVVWSGRPMFGASPDMAASLLAARRSRPDFLWAVNLRAGKTMERALKKTGLTVAWFDRSDDPDSSARERDALDWGVRHALSEHPEPGEVDAVCDWGAVGREPQVRLFGRDMDELFDKVLKTAHALERAVKRRG